MVIIWQQTINHVHLRLTSRSRAAVARRAHNPKVGSSILPFATKRSPMWPFLLMYKVYVLYSPSFNKIYIGFTSNFDARLKSHNEFGKKGWTIKFRPWELLFTEEFPDKQPVVKREKKLKTARGRKFIWSLIEKLR